MKYIDLNIYLNQYIEYLNHSSNVFLLIKLRNYKEGNFNECIF